MMHRNSLTLIVPFLCFVVSVLQADVDAADTHRLLKNHCVKCHSGNKPKGDFSVEQLGNSPSGKNEASWTSALERVEYGDMPPAKQSRMTDAERSKLVVFLRDQIATYEQDAKQTNRLPPRRLNNREFRNSVRDVLLLEHIGTHGPAKMLLGDTLHDGFDTHGESLGLSEYHLDQYVEAVRNVLNATILDLSVRPKAKRYKISHEEMYYVDVKHRKRKDNTRRNEGVEILGQQQHVYCEPFPSATESGYYRIRVSAKAVDHHVYDQEKTGIYDGDPTVLRMNLGTKRVDIELQEEKVVDYEFEEWLGAGTTLDFNHHTDGLRMIGNGNFKFQNRIAHDYLKENKPAFYQRVLTEEVAKATRRRDSPSHWVHWVPYWQGPRPVITKVDVEGPLYRNWPPERQRRLIGVAPTPDNALALLKPIAQRAWRKPVTDQELQPIVDLVRSQAGELGDVGAIREGILAILVSPSFLMVNPEDSTPDLRFATKLSYLLGSTTPDSNLIVKSRAGLLNDHADVKAEILSRLKRGEAEEFLKQFPYSWLQLDRINFMAPDIDRYPLYEKKEISEDMVNEALTFFRHCVNENLPVGEMLTANYSFINADLAKVYQVEGVPSDSVLRKHTFESGRRGGFLGMGAFLTLTADTLSTSPIHRAIYVMENLLGIHPSPPPADVDITEPDVRSARTIREVLAAHQSNETCASCHRNIDPFGYAFENFDPIGGWRDNYLEITSATTDNAADGDTKSQESKRNAKKRSRAQTETRIPIDASASFVNGTHYEDIREFRSLMGSELNQRRFVRCFVTKLLTYANGVEPENYSEIEAIVNESAKYDHRVVDTIAAVVDSPLFREE